mmetsp:Transcript_115456/g.337684  ORF Transcript_115456/g.337684 Transcript_115456/m.337684 type:complete len:407 (+) Transcript_115456:95-1315(+)
MILDKSLDELVEAGGAVRSRAGRSQRKSEPYGKGRGKGKGKSQNWASLVDSVREAQRSSRDWVTAWRELCDSEGTGDYDPARYDHEFLRFALAELGHSGAESELAADGDESWSKDSWRTSSGRRGSGSNNGLLKMRPGLGNGAGHADLVQSLKQWHRGKPRNANAWRTYCEEHGDGSYDPSRYTAAFLRGALLELAGGREEGGGGGGWEEAPLAEQVREWQRASLVHTLAWRQYCDERGGDGNYDPARYDAGFLRRAAAVLSIASAPSAPSGAGHTSLVGEVKALQRASVANTEAWRQFCDEEGGGHYDPGRHDAEFLQAALEHLSEPMSQQTSVGAARTQSRSRGAQGAGYDGPLTERVKALQRSSTSVANSWREYCDTEGDGSYDPSSYEASFLTTWLAKKDAW